MVVLHARRVLRLPHLLALVIGATLPATGYANGTTHDMGWYDTRDDAEAAYSAFVNSYTAGNISKAYNPSYCGSPEYPIWAVGGNHVGDGTTPQWCWFVDRSTGCTDGADADGKCVEAFTPPTEPEPNMVGPKGATEACFDGAEYKSVGVGVSLGDDAEMLSNWAPTGNQCSEGQPQMMPNDNPAGPGCVTGDSGMEVCDGDPGFNEQCGTFNGEYVCKAALPNGGACMVGEGGTNTCANNGVTAVTPQFDPATENFEVTSGPETLHMIDNSTGDVTNMTVQQGTVAQGSHGLTEPVPDQAGDGDGSGEDQGSGICEEAPKLCADEDGGGPLDVPQWGEEPTIEGSTGGYMDRLAAAPIIAAASGIADHMPSGVCPMIDLSTEYLGPATTNIHCDLYAEHAGTISALFLAMWSLLAVVVVLRA